MGKDFISLPSWDFLFSPHCFRWKKFSHFFLAAFFFTMAGHYKTFVVIVSCQPNLDLNYIWQHTRLAVVAVYRFILPALVCFNTLQDDVWSFLSIFVFVCKCNEKVEEDGKMTKYGMKYYQKISPPPSLIMLKKKILFQHGENFSH